jgi:hypothetical protein
MGSGKGKKGRARGNGRKEGLERERGGGDRRAMDREELSFPRFSNVGTPWEAKRGEDCAIFSGGMDALRAVAKILDLS